MPRRNLTISTMDANNTLFGNFVGIDVDPDNPEATQVLSPGYFGVMGGSSNEAGLEGKTVELGLIGEGNGAKAEATIRLFSNMSDEEKQTHLDELGTLTTLSGVFADHTITDFGRGFRNGALVKVAVIGSDVYIRWDAKIELKGKTLDVMPSFLSNSSYFMKKAFNPHKSPYIVKELRTQKNVVLKDRTVHKFERINGWEYFFTADAPSYTEGKQGMHATNTQCFQVKSQNQMKGSEAVIVGDVLAHQEDEKARWVMPRGISFCWSNHLSHNKSTGFKLYHMWFLVKLRGEKVARFVEIWNGGFVSDEPNAIEGDDWSNYQGGNGKSGAIRTFTRKDDYDYCMKYGAKLIGIYIHLANPKQNAVFNNFVDFFNVRLLFDTVDHPDSKIIIPPPTRMIDAQRYGMRIG